MKEKVIPKFYNNQWVVDHEFSIDFITEPNLLNGRLEAKNKFICQMYSDVKAF